MSEKQNPAEPKETTPAVPAPRPDGELHDKQLEKVAGGVRGPGTQTEDDVYVGIRRR